MGLRKLKPLSLDRDEIIDEPLAPPSPLPQREDEDRAPYATGAQLRMDLDMLRAEAQRNMITEDDDGNRFSVRRVLNPRILLMVVAVLAGGLAAFLAVGRFAPPEAPAVVETAIAPVAAPPLTKVLVAGTDLNMGQRLSAANMVWQDWPESGLRGEMITDAALPEAMTDMSGAIVRTAFHAGEPIRREKVVMDGDGYLSAILTPGKRAVSVSINAAAASGGYILPNDHVDVMLARTTPEGRQVSDTVLTNVRVLAINSSLGEGTNDPESPDSLTTSPAAFSDTTLAILELAPNEAEVIVNAAAMGPVALVLRPLTENGQPTTGATLNQSIRMSSPFWAK